MPCGSRKRAGSLFVLTITAMTMTIATEVDFEECVKNCTCNWTGGKRTVNCAEARLSQLPVGLSIETQVVNISGNAIRNIASRAFSSRGYTNLQRIFAARCGLQSISDDAFHLLKNLVELDLSYNLLNELPSKALSDCSGLRRLSLNHNPITVLRDDSLVGLKRLATLDLNDCKLQSIESSAFRGLGGLKFLRLAHNSLKKIQSRSLVEHLQTQLYELNLQDNPWSCDCELRDIRLWIIKNNIPLSVPPKCSEPAHLQGLSWSSLTPDDFACEPQMVSVDLTVAAREAENVTLQCEVRCQSSVATKWYFKNRQIHNMSLMSSGRQFYVIREHERPELKASTLTIVNVLPKDGGVYVCSASNCVGNATKSVELMINPREELWELTLAEIAGVIVVFAVLIIVLLLGVYMIIRQYARFCEQREASEADPKCPNELSPGSARVDKKTSFLDRGGAGFETVSGVREKNKHIVVGLLAGSAASRNKCVECCSPNCSREHFMGLEPLLEGYPQTLTASYGAPDDHLVSAVASELGNWITQRILSRQLSSLALSSRKPAACFANSDLRPQPTRLRRGPGLSSDHEPCEVHFVR